MLKLAAVKILILTEILAATSVRVWAGGSDDKTTQLQVVAPSEAMDQNEANQVSLALCNALLEPHHSLVKSLTLLSDIDFLKIVYNLYPEIRWLREKVAASPEGVPEVPIEEFYSVRLFGEFHPEFERTAVGLLALKWVLAGDYETFVRNQAAPVALTRDQFSYLRTLTLTMLPKSDDIDAMIAYMALSDLGKVKTFVNAIEKLTLEIDIDHDRILVRGLESEFQPLLSPSYSRLDSAHKDLIMRGLSAELNVSQFAQAENVPASLLGLKGLDSRAFEFYFLHLLYDVAGTAGASNPHGARTMNKFVFPGYDIASRLLPKLFKGSDALSVYNEFLTLRMGQYGLSVENKEQRAVMRLALMARSSNEAQVKEVISVFEALPLEVRAILTERLNVSGIDDGWAQLLYYSPAVIANSREFYKKAGHPAASRAGLEVSFMAFARVLQEAQIQLRKRPGNGVFTVMMSSFADEAKVNPMGMLDKDLHFSPKGGDVEVNLLDRPALDASVFPSQSFADLPGQDLVAVGIGGGSDGAQASQLAQLAEAAGKTIKAVISVRTNKTQSAGVGGEVGEERIAQNHGGEIFRGIFIMTPETTSTTGRFFEHLPSTKHPTYLVMDFQDGTLEARLSQLLEHIGHTDTVMLVDTGGDCLYSTTGHDGAKATPDQDLRVARVAHSIGIKKDIKVVTAVVAVGVDSPANAQQVLLNAGAKYISLNDTQVAHVLAQYDAWGLNGTRDDLYGKTPYAWQAALRSNFGLAALPIPLRDILSRKNPWNPFVRIDVSMAGVFFMDTSDHLRAIENP